jgi:hypothetical protein
MRKTLAAALAGAMLLAAAPAAAASFYVELGTVPNPNGGGTNDIPKFKFVNDTTTGTNLLPTITSLTLTLDATTAFTFGSVSNFGAGSAGIGLGGDFSPAASNPAVTATSKVVTLNYGATAFDPGAYSVFSIDMGPGTVNYRNALFAGTNTAVAQFSDGTSAQVTFSGDVNSTDRFYTFNSTPITTAVPEPATWAMMLLGFGMVGATARYRRRNSAVRFA